MVPSNELDALRQASAGDHEVLGAKLDEFRPRLRRMVRLRLDRRVQARIDASDVLHDAFVDVSRRLPEYLREPKLPFFLWVRFLVAQKILQLHRQHLQVKARDARREISLQQDRMPQANSASLAAQLIDGLTAPSQRAIQAELREQLREALDQLAPPDREILALRHFEQLSIAEAAQVLGIKPTAAHNRHVRALERLKYSLPQSLREAWE